MTADETTGEQDMKSVMRRLRKIMALTHSSNDGEAAAALHQAQALMAKHRLTAEAVAQSHITEHSVTATGKDLPEWECLLASVVSAALGVEIIVQSQRRQRCLRRSNAAVTFVGTECATQIAGYAYSVLRRQLLVDLQQLLNNAAAQVPECKGMRVTPTAAQRNAFAQGWCQAAWRKAQALMPAKDPHIADYIKQRVTGDAKIVASSKRSTISKAQAEVFEALGYREGKNAQLHQAMSDSEQQALLPG